MNPPEIPLLRGREASQAPQDGTVRLSVRIPADTYQAIKDLAAERQRSLAQQVRWILEKVAEDPEADLLDG